jgi:hypothetical protein
MDNLFNFVQDLTIAHDINMGLPAQKYNPDYDAPSSVNPDDVPDYIEPINPDDANSSLDEFVELHKKSKCYKDDNFEDFVCDDCDCKDWN